MIRYMNIFDHGAKGNNFLLVRRYRMFYKVLLLPCRNLTNMKKDWTESLQTDLKSLWR